MVSNTERDILVYKYLAIACLLVGCHSTPPIVNPIPFQHAASNGLSLAQQDTLDAEKETQDLMKTIKEPLSLPHLNNISHYHNESLSAMASADTEFSTAKTTYHNNSKAKDTEIANLKSSANTGIDRLIFLYLIAGPVGIGLFFYPPASLIGKGIAILGGAGVVTCTIVKASSEPLLWFARGAVVIALVWIIWKLFIEKRASAELVTTGSLLLKKIPTLQKYEVLKEIKEIQSPSTEAIVEKLLPEPKDANTN